MVIGVRVGNQHYSTNEKVKPERQKQPKERIHITPQDAKKKNE